MNMREIKFRAWDGRKMDYEFGLYGATLNKGLSMVVEQGDILMQYTGLKDKNGKEIYEGDVVEWWDCEFLDKENHEEHDSTQYDKNGKVIAKGCNPECGVVVYENEKACYSVEVGGYLYTIPYNRPLTVVGNIYNNPELIETNHD